MREMHVDNRATNAIKICINRILKNKNCVNTTVAELISSFSHASILKHGSVFQSINSNFYMVSKVKSPFWVEITHMPPIRLVIAHWGVVYQPCWTRASGFGIKKVFDPFGKPYLKKRGRKYRYKKPLYTKYTL